MALACSITKVMTDGQNCTVNFNLVASGSYVTGGDTVNLITATQDPAFQGLVAFVPSSIGVVNFDVWDSGGNLAIQTAPVMGSTLANNKVKFATAFNTELAAGLYSSNANSIITTSKLQGQATFVPYV